MGKIKKKSNKKVVFSKRFLLASCVVVGLFAFVCGICIPISWTRNLSSEEVSAVDSNGATGLEDSGFGEVFETPEIASVRDEIDFNINKNKNLISGLVQIQKCIKQKNRECVDGSRNICAGRKILNSSSACAFILSSGKKVSRMEYKEMICRACLEVELRLNQIGMCRERISKINCEIRCNNRKIKSLREELRLKALEQTEEVLNALLGENMEM